jgi:folylpolyglutamate synthase
VAAGEVPAEWNGPGWMLAQAGVASGLRKCSWPGRAQTVVTDAGNGRSVVFFMDGAHSPKSLECCMDWFAKAASSHVAQHNPVRLLLFNCAHSRDAGAFLSVLKQRGDFDAVLFAPGTARITSARRLHSNEILQELGLETNGESSEVATAEESWPETLANVWRRLPGRSEATAFKSVGDAVRWAQQQVDCGGEESGAGAGAMRDVHVLVSGSLLLVGDVLEELNWRPAKDGLKVEL